MSIGSLLWFFIGFSLTFGKSFHGVIGGLDNMFFSNVPHNCAFEPMGEAVSHIPGVLSAGFQMMFALMVRIDHRDPTNSNHF